MHSKVSEECGCCEYEFVFGLLVEFAGMNSVWDENLIGIRKNDILSRYEYDADDIDRLSMLVVSCFTVTECVEI